MPCSFDQPQQISMIEYAFPANVKELMPDYSSIPDEFKAMSGNPWVDLQSQWFFKGLTEEHVARLSPKPGIDATQAFRHLGTIQRSFQPKHEHKSAAVAYLMSRWFDLLDGGDR